MMRWHCCCIAVIATVALGGCHAPTPASPEPRPVLWLQVHATPETDANTYAGVVRARYESSLGFRINGKIVRRAVNLGDHVHAGQILAVLDARDYRLQARSSRAAMTAREADDAVAEADLQRYRELVDPGYVSRSAFDRQRSARDAARAQLEVARAQYRQAVNQLAYTELRADHDGVITAVHAEAGQVVSAGQAVMDLARDGAIEIDTSVPEGQVGGLQPQQAVRVTLTGLDGRQIDGRIREIASSADPATRTYDVRVRLPQPPAALRLGMTATVTVAASVGTTATFRLPLTALFPCGAQRCAWIIDPRRHTVDAQPLAVVSVIGNDVLVGQGLADGQRVVTAGTALLHPGQRVRLLTPAENAAADDAQAD